MFSNAADTIFLHFFWAPMKRSGKNFRLLKIKIFSKQKFFSALKSCRVAEFFNFFSVNCWNELSKKNPLIAALIISRGFRIFEYLSKRKLLLLVHWSDVINAPLLRLKGFFIKMSKVGQRIIIFQAWMTSALIKNWLRKPSWKRIFQVNRLPKSSNLVDLIGVSLSIHLGLRSYNTWLG